MVEERRHQGELITTRWYDKKLVNYENCHDHRETRDSNNVVRIANMLRAWLYANVVKSLAIRLVRFMTLFPTILQVCISIGLPVCYVCLLGAICNGRD